MGWQASESDSEPWLQACIISFWPLLLTTKKMCLFTTNMFCMNRLIYCRHVCSFLVVLRQWMKSSVLCWVPINSIAVSMASSSWLSKTLMGTIETSQVLPSKRRTLFPICAATCVSCLNTIPQRPLIHCNGSLKAASVSYIIPLILFNSSDIILFPPFLWWQLVCLVTWVLTKRVTHTPTSSFCRCRVWDVFYSSTLSTVAPPPSIWSLQQPPITTQMTLFFVALVVKVKTCFTQLAHFYGFTLLFSAVVIDLLVGSWTRIYVNILETPRSLKIRVMKSTPDEGVLYLQNIVHLCSIHSFYCSFVFVILVK